LGTKFLGRGARFAPPRSKTWIWFFAPADLSLDLIPSASLIPVTTAVRRQRRQVASHQGVVARFLLHLRCATRVAKGFAPCPYIPTSRLCKYHSHPSFALRPNLRPHRQPPLIAKARMLPTLGKPASARQDIFRDDPPIENPLMNEADCRKTTTSTAAGSA